MSFGQKKSMWAVWNVVAYSQKLHRASSARLGSETMATVQCQDKVGVFHVSYKGFKANTNPVPTHNTGFLSSKSKNKNKACAFIQTKIISHEPLCAHVAPSHDGDLLSHVHLFFCTCMCVNYKWPGLSDWHCGEIICSFYDPAHSVQIHLSNQ